MAWLSKSSCFLKENALQHVRKSTAIAAATVAGAAEVLSNHAERQDHFIRPHDAKHAATQFSNSHYLDRLQVATSAGMCAADARMASSDNG